MIISKNEACRMTGITRCTILRALRAGRLRNVTVADLRRWIIDSYAVDQVSLKEGPLDRLDAHTPEGQYLLDQRNNDRRWRDGYYWHDLHNRFEDFDQRS